MSAEQSQKNFDATPARKQKAKRDGNSARSAEVAGITAFAAATLTTFAILPVIGTSAAAALAVLAARPDAMRPPHELFELFGLSLLPTCAAATGAMVAGVLQAGGLRVVLPKWQPKRLDPVAGLKRMFGGEAIVGALRAIVAFTVVTLAVWPMAAQLFARSTTLGDPIAFGALGLQAAQHACWVTIAVGALFAVADYALTRRRWLRELKMTFEEIRRDQKENDGDPHARSRRKAMHRQFARGGIALTKDASFVIVNPTHIAIAIRYAPPAVAVPQILVRAADEGAHSVRLLARQYGLPIVENVALARALYAQGEAGNAIPNSTFVAVARVIAALVHEGALT